ncbi:MAG: cupin domain-containing protein [Actinobacteria bacterium]|nr:cupin domain-containing protein [Actinomycetota bacterium]
MDLAVGSTAAAVPLSELEVAPGEVVGDQSAGERVIFVLEGTGAETSGPIPLPFSASAVLFLPPRAPYEFLNIGATPARLLVVAAPAAPAAEIPPSRPPFGPVSWRELPSVELGAGLGFVGVRSTLAVGADGAGSESILLGVSRFAPGGRHDIHRHRAAAEVMYVLDGDGCRLIGEGGWARPLGQGESTFIPRDEWHGLANSGESTATVAFAYLGAASTASDGYELYGR